MPLSAFHVESCSWVAATRKQAPGVRECIGKRMPKRQNAGGTSQCGMIRCMQWGLSCSNAMGFTNCSCMQWDCSNANGPRVSCHRRGRAPPREPGLVVRGEVLLKLIVKTMDCKPRASISLANLRPPRRCRVEPGDAVAGSSRCIVANIIMF